MRYKFVFYGGRYECVMFLKSDIRANLCNSLREFEGPSEHLPISRMEGES